MIIKFIIFSYSQSFSEPALFSPHNPPTFCPSDAPNLPETDQGFWILKLIRTFAGAFL
jgi:hypothetical protein